jgi:hypothetical protein
MKFRRPSHATVVAYLALVTALGGSAYAASKIGTNDLKANAVTSPKIDSGAVRASDVKEFRTRSSSGALAANSSGTVTAECRNGERLLSGGYFWGTIGPDVGTPVVLSERPGNNDWSVTGHTPAANTLFAVAVCMRK